MNEQTEVKKRPTSITVICIIGFFGALNTTPIVFSPIAQQIGAWFPPYLAFALVVGFACMVGLWMMRKWAAYTYTGFAILNQVVLFVMGLWSVMSLLIPAVVIFFALKHVSKMS